MPSDIVNFEGGYSIFFNAVAQVVIGQLRHAMELLVMLLPSPKSDKHVLAIEKIALGASQLLLICRRAPLASSGELWTGSPPAHRLQRTSATSASNETEAAISLILNGVDWLMLNSDFTVYSAYPTSLRKAVSNAMICSGIVRQWITGRVLDNIV